jgi:NTE family protein
MMFLRSLVAISFLSLAFVWAQAQEVGPVIAPAASQSSSVVPGRPRIGLVLGGGGARGAAHIGVLEVLESLRVPVTCVAGTSVGALVAGAYASGVSPAQMRQEMAQADWVDMFQDSPAFSELSYRSKDLARHFLPGTETGVGMQGAQYQTGVVFGQKIKLFFNRLVRAELGEPQLEALPLPVSIVATDIVSGERVVFREGSLTQAMRASMSVPGLMAPVSHAGHKLVDGGLVDNLPVREVRERCQADVVIAVNVGSPLLKAADINSLLSVSAQMVNILTEQNVGRSLAILKPSDVTITPDLEGISAGDFQRNSEAADRGHKAALGVATRLQDLALSPTDYAAWHQSIQQVKRGLKKVDEVEIAGLRQVNPSVVARHLSQSPGGALDINALDQGLLRAYGDGFYESVDYSLLTLHNRNILRVTPVEKSWGPDYVRFGLNLDTNFNLDASYSLRAAYQKTWLNRLGGELFAVAEIGRRSRLGVDYYQPLEDQQRFFASVGVQRSRELQSIYQDDKRQAVYQNATDAMLLGAGVNIGSLGQVRLQWRETRWDSALETGQALFPASLNTRSHGWLATMDFDQQDRLYWPTRGWAARLDYFDAGANDYAKLDTDLRLAYPLGSLVLAGRLSYQGAMRGKLPFDNPAKLGGFMNMSGFSQGQLVGDDMRYASMRAEKIVGVFPLGLRGDMRFGVAFETAKVGTPITETHRTGWLNSMALYVGGETPLGPLYLGYGRVKGSAPIFYLYLGTP